MSKKQDILSATKNFLTDIAKNYFEHIQISEEEREEIKNKIEKVEKDISLLDVKIEEIKKMSDEDVKKKIKQEIKEAEDAFKEASLNIQQANEKLNIVERIKEPLDKDQSWVKAKAEELLYGAAFDNKEIKENIIEFLEERKTISIEDWKLEKIKKTENQKEFYYRKIKVAKRGGSVFGDVIYDEDKEKEEKEERDKFVKSMLKSLKH